MPSLVDAFVGMRGATVNRNHAESLLLPKIQAFPLGPKEFLLKTGACWRVVEA
jgi:hypothetical protein